ncbi:hypothetical protein GCM10010455_16970 [Microbacterium esteraromaticum]
MSAHTTAITAPAMPIGTRNDASVLVTARVDILDPPVIRTPPPGVLLGSRLRGEIPSMRQPRERFGIILRDDA